MLQIIIGILLTGVILYVGQIVAFATWGTRFLIATFISLVLFSLISASNRQEHWAFLRHKNGDDLKKWEYGCVAFFIAIVSMALLTIAYQYMIATLFVVCVTVIAWPTIFGSAKKKYEKAAEKRLAAMKEYKENPPASIMERLGFRDSTKKDEEVPDDVQEEALDDLYHGSDEPEFNPVEEDNQG